MTNALRSHCMIPCLHESYVAQEMVDNTAPSVSDEVSSGL
jgi:hypothetical protein